MDRLPAELKLKLLDLCASQPPSFRTCYSLARTTRSFYAFYEKYLPELLRAHITVSYRGTTFLAMRTMSLLELSVSGMIGVVKGGENRNGRRIGSMLDEDTKSKIYRLFTLFSEAFISSRERYPDFLEEARPQAKLAVEKCILQEEELAEEARLWNLPSPAFSRESWDAARRERKEKEILSDLIENDWYRNPFSDCLRNWQPDLEEEFRFDFSPEQAMMEMKAMTRTASTSRAVFEKFFPPLSELIARMSPYKEERNFITINPFQRSHPSDLFGDSVPLLDSFIFNFIGRDQRVEDAFPFKRFDKQEYATFGMNLWLPYVGVQVARGEAGDGGEEQETTRTVETCVLSLINHTSGLLFNPYAFYPNSMFGQMGIREFGRAVLRRWHHHLLHTMQDFKGRRRRVTLDLDEDTIFEGLSNLISRYVFSIDVHYRVFVELQKSDTDADLDDGIDLLSWFIPLFRVVQAVEEARSCAPKVSGWKRVLKSGKEALGVVTRRQ